MSWETLITSAASGFSALGSVNKGRDEAKAIAQEGTNEANVTADNTLRKAGTLTTSFLQSGLTLDDGPQSILKQAFAQGRTDIGRIGDNANNKAKAAYSAGRSKALDTLASGLSGLSTKGLFDDNLLSSLPDSFSYGLNDFGFGNSAYSALDTSDNRFFNGK